MLQVLYTNFYFSLEKIEIDRKQISEKYYLYPTKLFTKFSILSYNTWFLKLLLYSISHTFFTSIYYLFSTFFFNNSSVFSYIHIRPNLFYLPFLTIYYTFILSSSVTPLVRPKVFISAIPMSCVLWS